MKGAIPRSFVNSVNGIFPDATGNITYTPPVSSVNGETGATVIKNLYSSNTKSIISLPNETEQYAYITEKTPNKSANSTESTIQLYVDKSTGTMGWNWKSAPNAEVVSGGIYDSNHQPPYPVTSVNNSTGDIKITSLRATTSNEIQALTVDGGTDGSNNVALTDLNGTLVQVLRTNSKSTVNKVNQLCTIAPSWDSAHTVITNGRLSFSLTNGTLYITWANTDYAG